MTIMLKRLAAVAVVLAAFAHVLTAQTAGQATAAEAAPFLGEWTLELQGPDNNAVFDLSVKAEKDKVTGEISSGQRPEKQAISDVRRDKENLVLSYNFMYEGNPVDAVVTLSPAKEGKVGARIDFAGGAYTMTGSATKKAPAK